MMKLGKKEKLIKRLASRPKDFTFEEAVTLLGCLSFKQSNQGRTSGSRVAFIREGQIIRLHRPHPRKELLLYQIDELIVALKEDLK